MRPRIAPLVVFLSAAMLAPGASRAEAPESQEGKMNLAFVLLPEAKLPRGGAIERAFPAYAIDGQSLRYRPEKPDRSRKASEDAVVLDTGGGQAMVMLLPTPIPKGEADEAARYSISALNGKWKLPPHQAHLIVTLHAPGNVTTRLSLLTSILAAIAEASSAVGIYCGDAGATHDPRFFREIARSRTNESRLMLWTGISIAREGARYGLLSLGMSQFELPDLLLVVPPAKTDEAIPFMLDLLGMVVRDGKPLPEGDTVGRSATEKLPVRYVPSPVDPKAKVWRVEMK